MKVYQSREVIVEKYQCEVCCQLFDHEDNALRCESRHACRHEITQYEISYEDYPAKIYTSCECGCKGDHVEILDVSQDKIKRIYEILTENRK